MNGVRRVWHKVIATYRFLRYGPVEMAASLRSLESRIDSLESRWGELSAGLVAKTGHEDLNFLRTSLTADLQREASWLRDRLVAVTSSPGASPSPATSSAALPGASSGASAASPLEDAFYPALERQFRGTPDEIRAKLAAYEPWVRDLPAAPVADIGCGTGEWLELLDQWGLSGKGVDSNPLHVESIRARGMDADCVDALAWLRGRPPASLAAVTAFHVVEHLPLPVLLHLLEESWRVLVPGGRLILETPNPENLAVATRGFWLDPTHRCPLPPPLLEFMVRHAGLHVEAVPRLNPPASTEPSSQDPVLRELLACGRDYAVIARKPLA